MPTITIKIDYNDFFFVQDILRASGTWNKKEKSWTVDAEKLYANTYGAKSPIINGAAKIFEGIIEKSVWDKVVANEGQIVEQAAAQQAEDKATAIADQSKMIAEKIAEFGEKRIDADLLDALVGYKERAKQVMNGEVLMTSAEKNQFLTYAQ
ncbi:hypothetical protein ACH50O_11665 [Methylomonas sp. 2BW1-5-20]|uniref:hypothetical protein n=1 Tax=Methylomonas sp. 2BW1-5-20 TaxID=3376686 RepID=UPI00405094F9